MYGYDGADRVPVHYQYRYDPPAGAGYRYYPSLLQRRGSSVATLYLGIGLVLSVCYSQPDTGAEHDLCEESIRPPGSDSKRIEEYKIRALDIFPRLAYNNTKRFVPPKDCEGNKMRDSTVQRVGGGCKPTPRFAWIAHPGVVRPNAVGRDVWLRYWPEPCWRLAEGALWRRMRVVPRLRCRTRPFAGTGVFIFTKEVFAMKPSFQKYRPFEQIHLPDRQWPNRVIDKGAPVVQRRPAGRQSGPGRPDEPRGKAGIFQGPVRHGL